MWYNWYQGAKYLLPPATEKTVKGKKGLTGMLQAKKRVEKWGSKFRDMRFSQKITIAFLTAALLIYGIMAAALQVAFRIYDSQLYEKSQAELDFFANMEFMLPDVVAVPVAVGSTPLPSKTTSTWEYVISPEFAGSARR